MKALTWHGKRDVRVDEHPDPTIEKPTDAIIQVTSTGLCGSDLHLYEVLGPFLGEGDILGHEPMGIVQAVGAEVTNLQVGDRHDLAVRCLRRHRGPAEHDADLRQAADAEMGQANVRRWTDEIIPLLTDGDPLGVDGFATHHIPLTDAPEAYKDFQGKADGTFKVVFKP